MCVESTGHEGIPVTKASKAESVITPWRRHESSAYERDEKLGYGHEPNW